MSNLNTASIHDATEAFERLQLTPLTALPANTEFVTQVSLQQRKKDDKELFIAC